MPGLRMPTRVEESGHDTYDVGPFGGSYLLGATGERSRRDPGGLAGMVCLAYGCQLVWKNLAMTRTTSVPLVDHTFLVQPESAAAGILVGSPAWYAWLTDANSCGRIWP